MPSCTGDDTGGESWEVGVQPDDQTADARDTDDARANDAAPDATSPTIRELCERHCPEPPPTPACQQGDSEFCVESCIYRLEDTSIQCAECAAPTVRWEGGCNELNCSCTIQLYKVDCTDVCDE
jgi:hypothetical protein